MFTAPVESRRGDDVGARSAPEVDAKPAIDV
jgi:hypothetical protein